MPPWAISSDLKLRIPVLRHVQGLSIRQICEVLGTRKSLLYSSDKLADVTNSNLHKLDYCRDTTLGSIGCRRSLNYEDINYIKSHCYLHSSVFLDELQSQLLLCRHVKISLSTLFQTLRRLGITRKKVSRHALERNEEKRAAFMNRLAEIAPDPEMLMFGDDAAKNKHILDRQWDAEHAELIMFNPDPLSEEHDGRFFLSSPMILYMAR
ncbi:hypothetical protein BDR04DRAFT_1068304 [Suillus decipiens]|nr:hypothetical protein BDR04DRAFT_1068304 [Suillus decipiens]